MVRAFLWLVTFLGATYAQSCEQNTGPVNCKTCHKTDRGYASNRLDGLPRVIPVFTFAPGGNNIGQYQFCDSVECPNLPDVSSLDVGTLTSVPPSEPQAWIMTLLMYVLAAIIFAVVSVLGSCCFCCGRYCCDCCCGPGGACGRRFPTRKVKLIGFEKLDGNRWGYSALEKWGARIFMAIFLFFIILWLGLGEVAGNIGLTKSLVAVIDAPVGLADQVQGLSTPVDNLIIAFIGLGISLVQNLNQTLTNALDLNQLVSNIDCIATSVNGLPDPNVLGGLIDDFEVGLNGLIGAVNGLPAALDQTTVELQNITNATVVDLQVVVNNTQDKVTSARNGIVAAQASLQSADSSVNATVNGPRGANVILADLDKLDAFNSSFNAAAVNSYDATLDAFEGEVQRNVATYAAVGDKSFANASLIATDQIVVDFRRDNFSATADLLAGFNADVNAVLASGLIDQAIGNLSSAQTALAGINGTTALLDSIVNASLTRLLAFRLDTIRTALGSVQSAVDALPTTQAFRDEIAKVNVINTGLACIDDLAAQILALNDTLVELPAATADAVASVQSLNDTIAPALDQVNVVLQQLDNADAQRASFNLSGVFARLDQAEADGRQAALSFNSSEFLSKAQAAETQAASVDFSAVANLNGVKTALQNALIPQAFIDDLNALEQVKVNIANQAAIVAQSIRDFESAQCSVTVARFCRLDSDCPGGETCNLAVVNTQRCQIAGTVCCDVGSPQCAAPTGPCPPGDRCLYSPAEFNTLRALQSAGLTAAPGSAVERSKLQNLVTSQSAGTLGTDAALTAALAAFDQIDFAAINQDIDQIQTSLSVFDAQALQADVTSLNNSLSSVDLAAARSQISAINDSFVLVRDANATIVQGQAVAGTVLDLVFVEVPNAFAQLTQSALQALVQDAGLSAVVKRLVAVAQGLVDFVGQSNVPDTLSSNGVALPVNLTALNLSSIALVTEIEGIMDQFEKDYTADGPIAWAFDTVALVANTIGFTPPVPTIKAANAKDSVLVDANKDAYPGAAYCVDRSCIENLIDDMNTLPLTQLTNGSVPVPLSREDLVGLPYLLPLFFVLIPGVVAIIGSFIVCFNGIGKCLTCLMWFCMACQLPFIFCCAGSVWPLVMAIGDVCYGGENAGFQFVDQRAVDVCSALEGTALLDGTCDVTVQGNLFNIDVVDLYVRIFSGDCGANDPLGAIMDTIRDIVQFQVANLTTNISGSSPVPLRPPLQQAISNATDVSLPAVVTAFFADLKGAVNCRTMNRVYLSFKDVVCCDILTAFYWAIGSWYLIAWTYCCCGCFATCMGRKRFAHELWGAQYEKAVSSMHKDNMEMDAKPAARGSVSSVSKGSASESSQSGKGGGDPTVNVAVKRQSTSEHVHRRVEVSESESESESDDYHTKNPVRAATEKGGGGAVEMQNTTKARGSASTSASESRSAHPAAGRRKKSTSTSASGRSRSGSDSI